VISILLSFTSSTNVSKTVSDPADVTKDGEEGHAQINHMFDTVADVTKVFSATQSSGKVIDAPASLGILAEISLLISLKHRSDFSKSESTNA
jgi:DUF4097 and DUF4098 domain-containing protein YvlB